MENDPGVTGFDERIELARAAVEQTLEAYQDIGQVNVLIVDFAGSAANSGWLSGSNVVQQVDDYLEDLDARGSTNYEAALEEVQDSFGTPPGGEGFRNISYFLTDGVPTSGNVPLSDDNVSDWEAFLGDNDITTFAVGIGTGIPADDPDLVDVAFMSNPIVVTDESELIDTLLTTITTVQGNVLADAMPEPATFGADGGFIQSITVDGTHLHLQPDQR